MGRILYTTLFLLLYPVILFRLFYRSFKAPAYAYRWQERLGIYAGDGSRHNRREEGCIWVHAVSVGETMAALPLIRELQSSYPGQPIVVTTMTPTGSERVRAALGDSVQHVYAPYDSPGAIKRFLSCFKPRILIIMETELWPNTIHYTKRFGAKVALVNARLSERSARGYGKVRWLSEAMLQNIDLILAQGEADAGRFRMLGVSEAQLSVTGSIKFDLTISAECLKKGQKLRGRLGENRSVWIAASTHDGEDEILLSVHKILKQRWPDLCLILVPRHPERFQKVVELVVKNGLAGARQSQPETAASATDVLVGDTMGELMEMYAAADMAFVGGSLVVSGGHNPLEPAALALPVVMGPYVFNFAEICEHLREAGGLELVDDADQLSETLGKWLTHADERKLSGQKGQLFQQASRGALQRVMTGLDRLTH